MKLNKKILVIEDDASIRESITELLHLEGFEVHSLPDGSDGLKQIEKWQPDLIISDIRMPGMNGLEMLELYTRNKDHVRIPFLFLSALAEKTDVRAGMNLGADDYLTKPFTRAELLAAIWSQLAKKKKREASMQERCDQKVLRVKQEVQEERNVLLAEIHHRVKNNLALISALIQLQDGESQSDRELALNLRISTIALVHEEVYNSDLFSVVNIQRLIEKMSAEHLRTQPHIKSVIQLEAVELDMSKAVPFGLLVHELLDNAVKHAFLSKKEGGIQVKLHKKNDQLHLHISDNGIGIPEISGNKYPLGLTLAHATLQQISGTIECNTSPETGTAYEISIPVEGS